MRATLLACLALAGAPRGAGAAARRTPAMSATAGASFWMDPERVSRLADAPSAERLAKIRAAPWRGGLEPAEDVARYEVRVSSGALPADLKGTLSRNGAGRVRVGDTQYGHWFDGDGLVSSLSISEGRAFYQQRFVETERFAAQRRRGSDRGFAKAGAWTKRGLGRVWENLLQLPTNPANTNVLYLPPASEGSPPRLWAVCEGGPPVAMDPQRLSTLGDVAMADRSGGASPPTFSAHYSRDAATGQLFNHGIVLGGEALLNLMEVDPRSGDVLQQRRTALPYLTFVHDAALSEEHLSYFVVPYGIRSPSSILRNLLGREAFGGLYEWMEDMPTLVHVHRRADLTLRHAVEVPATSLYHVIDAFEAGDGVLRIRSADLLGDRSAQESAFADLYSAEAAPLCGIRSYEIDLESGELLRKEAVAPGAAPFELPETNGGWPGRKRFLWTNALSGAGGMWLDGVQKVDMETGEVSDVKTFGEMAWAGAPVFVPRAGGTAEDDGYIMTQVYRANEHRSDVVVMDAADLRTLAVLELEHHVPYQFHGDWADGFVA